METSLTWPVGENDEIRALLQCGFATGVLEATDSRISRPTLALSRQPRIFGVLDPLNSRLKYFLMAVFAAVVTAAALRHVIHTYGGFTRQEIRLGAIVAIGAIAALAFALAMLRRKPRP